MNTDEYPPISIIFFILAALCFLGGVVLYFKLSPGDGYNWKTTAYIPSMIAFVSGFVQAALLSAIGQGLYYLHRIVENTSSETKLNSINQVESKSRVSTTTNHALIDLPGDIVPDKDTINDYQNKLSTHGYTLVGSKEKWEIKKGTLVMHCYSFEDLKKEVTKLINQHGEPSV